MKFIFEHIDIKYMQYMSEDIYIREILAMALPLYALPMLHSLFHKHNLCLINRLNQGRIIIRP